MTQFSEIIRTGKEQKELDFLVLSQSPGHHTNTTQSTQHIYIAKDNVNI